MKRTDRFARVVQRMNRAPHHDVPWVYESDAITLLRAEHHAVVRLVKGMLKKHEGVMLTMAGAAYDAALKQVLAELARRKR